MGIDLKDKLASFKTLLGGGQQADEVTNSLLASIAEISQSAVNKGLVTKEQAADPPPAADPGDEGDDDDFVGDMTMKEFVPFMAAIVKAVVGEPVAPVTKEVIAAVVGEVLAAPNSATTKAASETSSLLALVNTMAGQMNAMQATLKELTSDEPRIMRGFIASQSSETVKQLQLEIPRVDEIDQIAARVAQNYAGGQ